MKVVINSCFGGFNLSHAAVMHYAALKGLTLYPENDSEFSDLLGPTYWLVPKERRAHKLSGTEWTNATMEQRRASNLAYAQETLSPTGIARNDPHLVATVETLGDNANGKCAKLRVVEIPDDVEWEISEYDGNEHVAEKHRTWD